MRIFDPKFRGSKRQYVSQCALAAVLVLITLALLDIMSDTAIIASLGATSFIAFMAPHANSSKPRYLLGGYAVGMTVGTAFKLLGMIPVLDSWVAFRDVREVVLGAIAVGCTMFVMVILNFEHPPACGLALGIVLNDFSWWVLLVVAVGVSSITLLKTLLKPWMKNLY